MSTTDGETVKGIMVWDSSESGNPCQALINEGEPNGISKLRQCAIRDPDKPMCFRGEPWCSVNHQKIVLLERDLKENLDIPVNNANQGR